jgi:hypothetical protein
MARLTLVILVIGIAGCGGDVPPVTGYTNFVAKDASFSIEHPTGWTAEGGARPDNTFGWGEFKSGPAKIRVTADIKGSLMGDLAGAGRGGFGGGDPDPELEPVAIVHSEGKQQYSADFSGYEEGPPEIVRSKMGTGRVSTFAASGKSILGFRGTFLAKNRRITIICQCPKRLWVQLKPVFVHVIQELGR